MVDITHHEPPHGVQSQLSIVCEPAVETMFQELVKAGFHVESEHLRLVSQISLTVGDDDGDYVYVIKPSSIGNDEALTKAAIAELIQKAHAMFKEGTLGLKE